MSNYGEDLRRPVITGFIIFVLSLLFWMLIDFDHDTIFNTFLSMHFKFSNSEELLRLVTNATNVDMPLERSLVNIIPLIYLENSTDNSTSVIDNITKFLGLTLSFGFIIIELRRKFKGNSDIK